MADYTQSHNEYRMGVIDIIRQAPCFRRKRLELREGIFEQGNKCVQRQGLEENRYFYAFSAQGQLELHDNGYFDKKRRSHNDSFDKGALA